MRTSTEKTGTKHFIHRKFERADCILNICAMAGLKRIVPFLIAGLIFSLNVHAQRRTQFTDSLNLVRLNNGLNMITMYLPNSPNTEINFFIKAGSLYENDSLSGLANIVFRQLRQRITTYLVKNTGQFTLSNTPFDANFTSEYAIFRFIPSADNFERCFSLMRDSVFNTPFTDEEISWQKELMVEELQTVSANTRITFEKTLLKGIYRQDFEKVNLTGNPAEFRNMTATTANLFWRRYYVPNNTIVTSSGNFNWQIIEQVFTNSMSSLVKSQFDPETITKIFHLRPMVFNTQFIQEDSTATPEFQICWQFPGTTGNVQASYCAFLLSEILNDRNNFIQVKAAKMGCKKIIAQYEANNFSAIFRIILQPGKENLYATYKFAITELQRLEKTLLNETMLNAGKLIFKRNYNHILRSKEYPAKVALYTAFKDNSYFRSLADSVFDLKVDEVKSFANEYLKINPYITGLLISKADRESLQLDSAFTNLNDSVSGYVFTYRKNITDIEGENNAVMLRNLLQWLTVNPEVNVQLNGFSDEGEFDKVKDEQVFAFIDSLPDFRLAITGIKGRYLRPDMMRAMKIAKYLYENGISSERLSGTGMKFSSENEEQEAANMKCTITLDKLRKGSSLYEIHYGKKQE